MNNERLNLELRGGVRTVTPFANSPESRQPKKGKKDPQKLPVISVWRDGQLRADVLFISASAIRGVLRRAASEEIAAHFDAMGEEVKFSEWLLWSIGGVTDDKKSNNARVKKIPPPHPLDRHKFIQGNPVVALFGAGKADIRGANIGDMIGSKLHIAHAILEPDNDGKEIKPTIHESARAHEDRSPRLPEILPEEELEVAFAITATQGERATLNKRESKLKQALRPSNKNLDDETRKKLQEELEKIQERQAEIAELREIAGNAVGRPLAGYETIPPGIEIPHRMTLTAATPAQVGLFFAALRRFGRSPFIGAHRAHNCGRVYCDYRVWRRDENGEPTELGRLKIGEENDAAEAPAPFFIPEGEALKELTKSAMAEWEKVQPEALRPYSEKPAKGAGQ